ncbi:protein snakeskin [Copidosoma floridanum]|uniref:protein snakeskin n=1 Tax=Copidosoma floridanum TaxID=29053 RepID=UPI0006C978B6|nr:protein snakeskin [Copidosoma floridanum]
MNGEEKVSIQTIGGIILKVVKVLVNIVILIIYRTGYGGEFLGVGGTWNLNEEKSPDVEIIASGIFVGFFIYTSVVLISYCFGTLEHKKTIVEIIMNFIGMFMFIVIGGIALHYWHGYMSEHKYIHIATEKQVGIALGLLCIFEGLGYLLDLIFTVMHYLEDVY